MRARLGYLILAIAMPLAAHDVITTNLTWSRDISRIFARRCIECHGANASIPLTTYEQARPWAVDIKEQVLSRAMPPWGAVKGFGDLSPDRALSQEEMLMIAAWVVGGAPEGDLALAPKNGRQAQAKAPLPEKNSALAKAPAPLKPLISIDTQVQLANAIVVGGIAPLPDAPVESAKITATLPDGNVVPIVWLYRYNPAWKTTFRFAKPVTLPAGTKVSSSCPLRFALTAPSPAR